MAVRGSSQKRQTTSITAQNTFSAGITIQGDAIFELTGTWVATVHVQRRSDGTNWRDVTDNNAAVLTFTTNGQFTFTEPARNVQYRFGVKTGNFTSGTVAGEFQQ